MVQLDASPTPEDSSDDFPEQDVLSAEVGTEVFDETLSRNAVPDTACRRSLVGAYTLGRLEAHLKKQGYQVKRVKGNSTFRFGNAGTLVSQEVAILPCCLGGKKFLVKASILPDEGRLSAIQRKMR